MECETDEFFAVKVNGLWVELDAEKNRYVMIKGSVMDATPFGEDQAFAAADGLEGEVFRVSLTVEPVK